MTMTSSVWGKDGKAHRVFQILEGLRGRGWRVAVHNDYQECGRAHTFWLFTSIHGPWFAQGESTEDVYALMQVLDRVNAIEAWSRSMDKRGLVKKKAKK